MLVIRLNRSGFFISFTQKLSTNIDLYPKIG